MTVRGNAQQDIYTDHHDRQQFLDLLGHTVHRQDLYCRACCVMDNHDHLLIETSTPTLTKCIKFLNGTYTLYSIDTISA